MNGIGLLIIVVAYILVWIAYVRLAERNTWREWNRKRCLERRHYLLEFKDCLDEAAYRNQLRHILVMKSFTSGMNNIQITTNTTTESFHNSNDALQKVVEILTSDERHKEIV